MNFEHPWHFHFFIFYEFKIFKWNILEWFTGKWVGKFSRSNVIIWLKVSSSWHIRYYFFSFWKFDLRFLVTEIIYAVFLKHGKILYGLKRGWKRGTQYSMHIYCWIFFSLRYSRNSCLYRLEILSIIRLLLFSSLCISFLKMFFIYLFYFLYGKKKKE